MSYLPIDVATTMASETEGNTVTQLHVSPDGFGRESMPGALDTARPGDVILLHAGVYDDAIDTYGRDGKEVVHVDVRSDSE